MTTESMDGIEILNMQWEDIIFSWESNGHH